MNDAQSIVTALGPGAALPLAMFIIALYRRMIVLGWQYDLMVEDRNYWRNLYESTIPALERSVDTTGRLAERVRK